MVLRWNHIATIVVATLTVIHCELIDSSQTNVDTRNIEFEELCPCLPEVICPRVYGTKPEDVKYLGEMTKCVDDNSVRCCGASASFVVGKNNGTTDPPVDKVAISPAPQSDILSRLNTNDVQENEIPDAESESVKMLRDDSTDEVLSLEETENISNFHTKQRLNGETDDEASESKSVIKTVDAEFQHQQSTEDDQLQPEVIPSEIVQKSYRQPKTLDSVMMVYPNIMSGIPKTTPKNMPETNEMKMFDQDIGMDLHLVFSKTTTKPETVVEVQPTDATVVDTTTKSSLNRFAKRRRQYKPSQRPTTESPAESIELKPTTVRSRTVTRQRIKMRNYTSRSTTQEPTDSTTKQPRVKLSTRAPATQETDSTTTPSRVTSSTTTLSTTEETEILVTSEGDKSHQSRFRLFNARHRLNYLRRNTTTTSTESQIEVTTRPTAQSKPVERRGPSKGKEKTSKITSNVRPTKMNETLILVVDTNHRNMLSKVHLALKEAPTEHKISEIPRSFAGVEMNNRVKKVEKMLVEQMINVYTETKAKQRGVQLKKEQVNNIHNDATEQPISKQRSDSTRPYRGNKKFQMSDSLDKTPVVPIPNEIKRTVRVRTTTVTPVERDDTVTTTRRPHRRRPLSIIQETNSRDVALPQNNEETNTRRRVISRRRYNVNRSSASTTLPPPVPESLFFSTTPTISTEKTTTPLTESTPDINETQSDFEEQLVESIENVNEPIPTVNIDESAKSITLVQNADVLSNFKPSPLWSISSDEKNDFNNKEDNHSYEMNMNERALRNGQRRSRNTFDPPALYLNGFMPVSSLGGPVNIVGSLPKSQFGKN